MTQIRTGAGLRPATGACVTCSGIMSFRDAAKDAAPGPHPLYESETGRLAHFCEEHARWPFRRLDMDGHRTGPPNPVRPR